MFRAVHYRMQTNKNIQLFSLREIPITPKLTVQDLFQHANGSLRYNNINDLAHSGPQALQWFIDRSNTLFRQNGGGQTHRLSLSYLSVLCRDLNENESKAFPIYDFIRFRIDGTEKSGYGVMFSSQLREYYRDQLESSKSPFDNSIDRVFLNSIFTKTSPSTGILESYPILMLPRTSSEAVSLTDAYMKRLGLVTTISQPAASQFPFRYLSKSTFETIDPEIFAAASSIGQAMFEIVRPHLYPMDESEKPNFNMQHLLDIKWTQHKKAKEWIHRHVSLVERLLVLQSIERPAELDSLIHTG